METIFLGIDPGLTKCGYAAVSSSGQRLRIEVIPTDRLTERLQRDLQAADVRMICVGNATTSARAVSLIKQTWPQAPVILIDETNTTLQARRLYYKDHPPRGLMRLIPRGLLVPKEPLDGYAALLIVQRYLAPIDGHGM